MLKNPSEYEKGRTIVYFVRHGERIHIPNAPESGIIIPGPGLNLKGKKQAKRIAKELSKMKPEIDILYCSEMTRAIETAEEISKTIGKKPIIVKDIAEFTIAAWKKQFYKKEFWENYFKQRKAIKAFNKILDKDKEKVIVIVAHGNVIKTLVFRKMGLSLKNTGRFHQANCYVSIARYIGRKLDHVCCFNNSVIDYH
jgi:broad specificity phosphatase PhoE